MTKALFASLRILLPILILVLAIRCANPVMPSGGIKDTDPPEVVSSMPLNKSVLFNGRTLILTFNEFVKLEKAQEQILISPPPQTKPEFRLRGKSLIIRFEEDLLPQPIQFSLVMPLLTSPKATPSKDITLCFQPVTFSIR